MVLNNINDLIEHLEFTLGASSTFITLDGYEAAIEEALLELDTSFPVTDNFLSNWIIKRAKRHILFILYIESANRFQYKQLRLNHRFDHYQKIIEGMDAEFEKEKEEDWTRFINVSPDKMFGTQIRAGFQYNKFGTDKTYDFEKYVDFTPR